MNFYQKEAPRYAVCGRGLNSFIFSHKFFQTLSIVCKFTIPWKDQNPLYFFPYEIAFSNRNFNIHAYISCMYVIRTIALLTSFVQFKVHFFFFAKMDKRRAQWDIFLQILISFETPCIGLISFPSSITILETSFLEVVRCEKSEAIYYIIQ